MKPSAVRDEPRRVLIVAEHLSHYRFGVYSILDSDPEWRFAFLASPSTRDGSIVGIPPSRLSDVRILSTVRFGRLLWQRGLVQVCLTDRADAAIFVGNAQFVSSWLAAAVLRLRRVPVYFWTIGWHRPDRGIKRVARLLFYRLASRLLLYGSDGAKIGESMGYPRSRMTIIGNSYESCCSAPARNAGGGVRDRLPPVGKETYVGAVTRLTAEKRFDLLIHAVSLLRAEGCEVAILLVGQGEEESRLREQADDAGVPLILLGPIYDEGSLRQVYARLSVTVLPERAGLAVIQSLVNGTPVVTANDPNRQVPEFRAIREGVTGALYEAGGPTALAAAIANCLDMIGRDPESVARHCRDEVVDNWSPEQHASRILTAISC